MAESETENGLSGGLRWFSCLPVLGNSLPLLLGPMAGCLIAALCRQPMEDMECFSIFMRTFLELRSDLPSHLKCCMNSSVPAVYFLHPILRTHNWTRRISALRRVFHYDKGHRILRFYAGRLIRHADFWSGSRG